MGPSQSERPRLRKREIAFAVAAGIAAAGGAALMLELDRDQAMTVGTSGPATLTYPLAPFERVATLGAHDVVISYGETQSVRGEGPPGTLAGLEVAVRDGQLTIRPNGIPQVSDWEAFRDVTYYVTVPRLEAISLAGSGEVRVDRIEGKRFSGAVRGAGELSIGEMHVEDAELAVRGTGELAASGRSGKTRVSIEGSGEIDAEGLRSTSAMVTVTGPGNVELTVDDDARVSVTGGGNVDIEGAARCEVSRAGTGNVRCAGGADSD